MLNRNVRKGRLVGVLVLIVALMAAAYAFTASNTVPASKAGDGSGVISGYTVTNVAYTLATATPSNIDKVAFTLDATAGTVKAKLVSSSSTYTDCTNTSGNNWSCDVSPDVAVTAADELRVIATS